VTSPAPPRAEPSDRDLEGRTFLVTGATTGLGHVAARVLAGRGARVLVGCRSVEKGEVAIAALRAALANARVELAPLAVDLGDLASVRAAAATLEGSTLDGLLNNAGIAGARGLTASGVEMMFGVNHLGHFLLTRLLEGALRRASAARVVHVASAAHTRVSGIDFAALTRPTRSLTTVREYAVSKLCNILFSRELARRWAGSGITSYALHPGRVPTQIWRHAPAPVRWWSRQRSSVTEEEGARTIVTCAAAPELAGVSGRYYEREREVEPSGAARDDALAARLWDESERLTGLASRAAPAS
jgi:NAD(P)-dependent dehydrogenase (short-subunit alcohol dehydrogenase family)